MQTGIRCIQTDNIPETPGMPGDYDLVANAACRAQNLSETFLSHSLVAEPLFPVAVPLNPH